MNIAVVTPIKGDRPNFLHALNRMLDEQTIQPDTHIVVDDKHESVCADVTWRYRIGIGRALKAGADFILFMEDDDWYSPMYIQKMAMRWVEVGTPKLFGIEDTVYYHIRYGKYRHLVHPLRASMMSTAISKDFHTTYCADNNPFLDLHFWRSTPRLGKVTVLFEERICLGIKHGLGAVAGGAHKGSGTWYNQGNVDTDGSYLKSLVSDELLTFYNNLKI